MSLKKNLIALSVATSTLLAGIPLQAAGPVGYSYSTPRYDDRHDHRYDHRDDYRRDYERRDDYRRDDYHHDDRHPDHRHVEHSTARLVKLGSVSANCQDYQNDLFEIRSNQKFTGIVFRVDRGDVAVDRIRVTFENDTSFLPETKVVFREGERTCRIDFPGYNREVKRVRIRYQSLSRGPAIIDVYGIPCN